MPTYPYQLLKPGNDSVRTTASGDNFFDVCVSISGTYKDGLHRCYISLHVCGCLYGVGGCMRVCECVLPSIHHSQFLIASYCWNARAPVTPRWEETLVLDVHIYGIPHHLVMLPPMMNMEFYDIDISGE